MFNSELLKLETLDQQKYPVFSTTIKQNSSYLRIADNLFGVETSVVPDDNTTFEIEIVDEMQLHIAYQRAFVRYYLNYNNTSFFFSSTPSFINIKFNYIIDGDVMKLFVNRGTLYAVNISSNTLVTTTPSESIEYRINNYVQVISPNIDVAWVAYDTLDKNSLDTLLTAK
jgi:hypothetical protein